MIVSRNDGVKVSGYFICSDREQLNDTWLGIQAVVHWCSDWLDVPGLMFLVMKLLSSLARRSQAFNEDDHL